MNTALIVERIERLAAAGGVRVAVAATAGDGLVLHAAGEDRTHANAVAALFSASLTRAAALGALCGGGEVRLTRVRAGDAQVLATAVGSVVLIAVAGRAANSGRLRLELLRAAEALA